jgi:hypothetical protein
MRFNYALLWIWHWIVWFHNRRDFLKLFVCQLLRDCAAESWHQSHAVIWPLFPKYQSVRYGFTRIDVSRVRLFPLNLQSQETKSPSQNRHGTSFLFLFHFFPFPSLLVLIGVVLIFFCKARLHFPLTFFIAFHGLETPWAVGFGVKLWVPRHLTALHGSRDLWFLHNTVRKPIFILGL